MIFDGEKATGLQYIVMRTRKEEEKHASPSSACWDHRRGINRANQDSLRSGNYRVACPTRGTPSHAEIADTSRPLYTSIIEDV
jgi:hypothetical protein